MGMRSSKPDSRRLTHLCSLNYELPDHVTQWSVIIKRRMRKSSPLVLSLAAPQHVRVS